MKIPNWLTGMKSESQSSKNTTTEETLIGRQPSRMTSLEPRIMLDAAAAAVAADAIDHSDAAMEVQSSAAAANFADLAPKAIAEAEAVRNAENAASNSSNSDTLNAVNETSEEEDADPAPLALPKTLEQAKPLELKAAKASAATTAYGSAEDYAEFTGDDLRSSLRAESDLYHSETSSENISFAAIDNYDYDETSNAADIINFSTSGSVLTSNNEVAINEVDPAAAADEAVFGGSADEAAADEAVFGGSADEAAADEAVFGGSADEAAADDEVVEASADEAAADDEVVEASADETTDDASPENDVPFSNIEQTDNNVLEATPKLVASVVNAEHSFDIAKQDDFEFSVDNQLPLEKSHAFNFIEQNEISDLNEGYYLNDAHNFDFEHQIIKPGRSLQAPDIIGWSQGYHSLTAEGDLQAVRIVTSNSFAEVSEAEPITVNYPDKVEDLMETVTQVAQQVPTDMGFHTLLAALNSDTLDSSEKANFEKQLQKSQAKLHGIEHT